ncbi:hypothetical protein FHP88_15675 [Sedimenticola selenatireducens]|uniref:Uncharacterized protein n=1 Tax=Sedimenticola selenatireducens TaxID=191960 RepID=A0A557S0D0_9GAMM|nr:hypothetical protein [Sedimenticola selenatireducens]TVO70892.1 hypothetical protein FHP88_15675 [Sedimenticola selenatireducens]
MGFTATDKDRLIADELRQIKMGVQRSVSDLNAQLKRMQHFGVFVFNSVLTADGDADAADLAKVVAIFREQRVLIDGLIPMLDDVEAINDENTPANIPANLAAFLSAHPSINMGEYIKRFDI